MGGMDSNDIESDVHLTWGHIELAVGDEVTVKVLPPGEADPPVNQFSVSNGPKLPGDESGTEGASEVHS